MKSPGATRSCLNVIILPGAAKRGQLFFFCSCRGGGQQPPSSGRGSQRVHRPAPLEQRAALLSFNICFYCIRETGSHVTSALESERKGAAEHAGLPLLASLDLKKNKLKKGFVRDNLPSRCSQGATDWHAHAGCSPYTVGVVTPCRSSASDWPL